MYAKSWLSIIDRTDPGNSLISLHDEGSTEEVVWPLSVYKVIVWETSKLSLRLQTIYKSSIILSSEGHCRFHWALLKEMIIHFQHSDYSRILSSFWDTWFQVEWNWFIQFHFLQQCLQSTKTCRPMFLGITLLKIQHEKDETVPGIFISDKKINVGTSQYKMLVLSSNVFVLS